MANNTGFNYYSVDTDRYQDMKIKRLKKDFSCAGIAVYDYLLCEIYRVKGCFIVWDENTVFDVAEYFGIKESLVNEIVSYCGVVGLFDRELLTRERILTSSAIQKRYLKWSKLAKRSNISIPKNVILPEDSEEIPEKSGKLPEKTIKTPEVSDKVKKSKVKESKVNPPLPPKGGKNDFLEKIIGAFQEAYFESFNIRYQITSKGKESQAAGVLAGLYKKQYPEAKTEDALKGLKDYFKKCCTVDDNWLRTNMSLPIIVSKFNEINNILKNGKSNRKPASNGRTIDDIVDAIFQNNGMSQ